MKFSDSPVNLRQYLVALALAVVFIVASVLIQALVG